MIKKDWQQTQEHFKKWWKREDFGRPLMHLVARRAELVSDLEPVAAPQTAEELHLDVERKVREMRNRLKSHIYLADAYPYLSIDIGPGSLATYLGSEPVFAWDTIWYKECAPELADLGELTYDPEAFWWSKHLDLVKQAKTLAQDDFLVAIPDIIENVDILSAMRGPQNLCFDLMDNPDEVKKYVGQLDNLYFRYYDALYEASKDQDGSSCYTAFSIWGPGKTAKVQCDFSAMMSPRHFEEFVIPSLQRQLAELDNSIYHLDGKDAIKHLDALMALKDLNGLQWTAGAAQPDGGSQKWYPIYDRVRKAGKGLWISIEDGGIEGWIRSAKNLVDRYGTAGLYLIFPVMSEHEADRIMNLNWK